MTLLYGLTIAIGAGGVLVVVALALDPARPALAAPVRHVLVGLLGFGLAGMSASFGGWPAGLAIVAAGGGAALLILLGIRYNAQEEE